MGKRLYTEVAAARHMSSGTGVREAPRPAAEPAPASGQAMVRPPGALKAEPAQAYRRKRVVAVILTASVFVSVPALIALLVLFG